MERTLHDLNQLADAMAKAYLAQRTENASGLGDAKVTMSVRQLIRTGIAPVSLMSLPLPTSLSVFSMPGEGQL